MNQAHSHAITIFWTIWITVSVASFSVVEFWMLAAGRPEDTLSENVWRLEDLVPGQPIAQWSALHVLFLGVYVLIFGWLLAHFGWGMWR